MPLSRNQKKNISLPWAAMARVDRMDEEILEKMANSGLSAIKYGIESADNKILKSCNKQLDLRRATSIINFTKKLGIKIHLSFCIGLPGESHISLEGTARFIDEMQPDGLQFSLATPFPGTELFNYVKEKGFLSSQHWPDYDGNYKCVVRTKMLGQSDLEGFLSDFCNNFNV